MIYLIGTQFFWKFRFLSLVAAPLMFDPKWRSCFRQQPCLWNILNTYNSKHIELFATIFFIYSPLSAAASNFCRFWQDLQMAKKRVGKKPSFVLCFAPQNWYLQSKIWIACGAAHIALWAKKVGISGRILVTYFSKLDCAFCRRLRWLLCTVKTFHFWNHFCP